MDSADLAFAGLARQAELVREGEISAPELCEVVLERIDRLDPSLNAFRVVMGDRAVAEAAQAQARLGVLGAGEAARERPLLGVPIAVKDSMDVAGELTTHGTGAAGAPASEDAEVVRRLRAAGAVIVGKTHMPELAMWGATESETWGISRNPWDPGRTPGGSSGGSAAAVASGMVAAASASDGLGSIRIPAACCGLFGLKPQRGRVSMMPDAEHWHGLSTIGPLTRSVLDSAVVFDAVMGHAPGDAESPAAPAVPFSQAARTPPGRLRIAWSAKPGVPPVRLHPVVVRALEDTVALLRAAGHRVHRHDPDYGMLMPDLMPRYLEGVHRDAERLERPERLEARTRALAAMGGRMGGRVLRRAREREAAIAIRLGEVFRDADVLVTPTLPAPAPPAGRLLGHGPMHTMMSQSPWAAYTAPWNVTGQPAASVPAGFTTSGVPLAVQLVGRPGDEPTLLSLAAQIEAERPWTGRRPPVS